MSEVHTLPSAATLLGAVRGAVEGVVVVVLRQQHTRTGEQRVLCRQLNIS